MTFQTRKNNIKQPPVLLNILFEDNHLIAINKSSGDLVQGDKTGDVPLVDKVKAYIKKNITNQAMSILA